MLVTAAVGTTITIQKEALCVCGNAMDQVVTGVSPYRPQVQYQTCTCGTYRNKAAVGFVSLQVFWFRPSQSFHQCSILIQPSVTNAV